MIILTDGTLKYRSRQVTIGAGLTLLETADGLAQLNAAATGASNGILDLQPVNSGASRMVRFLDGLTPSAVEINWIVGRGPNAGAGGLEITPSTAAGGTTFTTPAMKFTNALITMQLPLTATGGITISAGGFAVSSGDILIGSSALYAWSSRGSISASANGVFTLRDTAGTSFDRLQFGGTTVSFPALRRTGAALDVIVADASAWAVLNVHSLTAQTGSVVAQSGITANTGNITATAGSFVNSSAGIFMWSGRSYLDSPANGRVRALNNAGSALSDIEGRDLVADRGDGSGVVYLNGATRNRYLYYDGTGYVMPTANLRIDGSLTTGGIISTGGASTMGLNGVPLTITRNTSAGVGLQVTNDTTYGQIRIVSSGTNQNAYFTLNPTGTGVGAFQVSDTSAMTLTAAGVLTPFSSVMPSGGVAWTAAGWARQFGLIDGGAIAFGWGGGANKRWLAGSSGGTLYFGHAADDGVATAPAYMMTLSSSAGVQLFSLLSMPGSSGIKFTSVDAGLYQSANKVYLGSYSASTYTLSVDYTTGTVTINNHLQMATNAGIYHATGGTDYTTAALMLRERGIGGGSTFEAPRLAFHWGGVVASQIGIELAGATPWTAGGTGGMTGRLAIVSNPGTAYENLAALRMYATDFVLI